MAPPELTRDAPILDILEPVLVRILVFCRIELQLIIHHWRQGDVGKVLHREEPLHGETWLDGGVRITLRVAHLVRIVLYLFHQTGFLQILGNLLTAVHAIHAHVDG